RLPCFVGYFSVVAIFACGSRLCSTLLELLFPPFKCPFVELNNIIDFRAPRFEATVIVELRHWHSSLFGNQSDRLGKRDAFNLHHKVENRSTFVTTKAVEDLFRWTNGKRRGLLFMKRTTRHPVRALLLKGHVILHYANDVGLAF